MLKTVTVGGPFQRYLANLLKGGPALEPGKFSLRQDTQVYFVSGADRVTLIFGIDFKERVDLAVAKIFLHVRDVFSCLWQVFMLQCTICTIYIACACSIFNVADPHSRCCAYVSAGVRRCSSASGRSTALLVQREPSHGDEDLWRHRASRAAGLPEFRYMLVAVAAVKNH